MKILLLSDPNSSHTIKWENSLKTSNIDVIVWGFDYSKPKVLQLINILKVIKEFKPDIVHAHYASSYGLVGALSGFSPFVLSVWGSDVFEFPKKSFIHQLILKFNLFKADKILSTSKIMAKEVQLYTKKEIVVTPFGVNIDLFKPKINKTKTLTIGLIKSLKEIYGIRYVIKAFSQVLLNNKDIKLLIVGSGDKEKKLKKLVEDLKITEYVDFVGNIEHNNIVEYHNKIDIFINISLAESFGVSVLEASSCEKPVIVTNVGGLPEVVVDNVTGLIVPAKNYIATAEAIEKLISDKELRIKMGKAGRKMVDDKYNWNDNLNQMINIYKELLS